MQVLEIVETIAQLLTLQILLSLDAERKLLVVFIGSVPELHVWHMRRDINVGVFV